MKGAGEIMKIQIELIRDKGELVHKVKEVDVEIAVQRAIVFSEVRIMAFWGKVDWSDILGDDKFAFQDSSNVPSEYEEFPINSIIMGYHKEYHEKVAYESRMVKKIEKAWFVRYFLTPEERDKMLAYTPYPFLMKNGKEKSHEDRTNNVK